MNNNISTDSGPDRLAILVRPAVSAIYGIFDPVDPGDDDGGELVGTGIFVKALRETSVTPINLDQFAETPVTGDFFLLGFPAKDSKFLRLLGGIHATALPFLSQHATSSDPYFNSNVHFALHYSYPDPSVDASGNPRDLPDPAGVSGSPVWSVDSLSNEQPVLRVVGIVQRHDPVARALIITRGGVVRRYLEVVRANLGRL